MFSTNTPNDSKNIVDDGKAVKPQEGKIILKTKIHFQSNNCKPKVKKMKLSQLYLSTKQAYESIQNLIYHNIGQKELTLKSRTTHRPCKNARTPGSSHSCLKFKIYTQSQKREAQVAID